MYGEELEETMSRESSLQVCKVRHPCKANLVIKIVILIVSPVLPYVLIDKYN